MDLQGQRELLLLNELDRNGRATQRSLASKLGVALGLTNLYLKRLTRKGYIKIATIPRNQIRYLLTAQGFAEKTRLTYQYMDFSLSYYRDIRTRLKEMLTAPDGVRGQRFVIFGTGELAELAYLSLREMDGTCVGFLDDERRESFLSYPVCFPEAISRWKFDKVLIADLDRASVHEARLIGCGVSPDKVMRLVLTSQRKAQADVAHV
ncbi:MAG: putative transcriptional regulator, AsnC family [Nitrospira sp.]